MLTHRISNFKTLNKTQKLISILLFAAFIVIGLSITDDYGVAWDDHLQTEIGKLNFEYATGQNSDILEYHDRYYGSAFEMPIYAIQQLFDSFPSQVFARHLITHFYFLLALFFLFRLLLRLFKSFPLAILGVLFLYLSPRIFAHSFFNTKDLPFLSTFIISLYTLWKFSEKPKSLKRTLIHAISCAFLIDIRLIGLLMPAITAGLLFLIYLPGKELKQLIKPTLLYSLFLSVFIYAFWPALWANPFEHIYLSFAKMAHFPWRYSTLLMGEMVKATENPWYYIPLWIGITSPLSILVFYILGSIFLIFDFFKNIDLERSNQQMAIFIFALIPIDLWILFLIIKPVFYDGWRHLYFFAPLMVIGAIYGIQRIYELTQGNKKAQIIFTITVLLFCVSPVHKIINLHPYQQTYFNPFISEKAENIRHQYEMDYWGLSFKEAFEKLLEMDSRKQIKVMVSNIAGIDNWRLSHSTDPRIELVENIEEAEYFISNYRFHHQDYKYKEVFFIERQGSRILSIFTLRQAQ